MILRDKTRAKQTELWPVWEADTSVDIMKYVQTERENELWVMSRPTDWVIQGDSKHNFISLISQTEYSISATSDITGNKEKIFRGREE